MSEEHGPARQRAEEELGEGVGGRRQEKLEEVREVGKLAGGGGKGMKNSARR